MDVTPSGGMRLRAWRKSMGLSQLELAIRVGSSRGSIANYETDRADIPPKVQNQLKGLGFDSDRGDTPSDYITIRARRRQLRLLLEVVRNDQLGKQLGYLVGVIHMRNGGLKHAFQRFQ